MVYRRQDTQGHDTAVIISMLVLEATTRSRWIRCGRCKKSQKLQDAQTKVQSDNLILRISLRLTKRIEDGMGGIRVSARCDFAHCGGSERCDCTNLGHGAIYCQRALCFKSWAASARSAGRPRSRQ